MNCPRCTTEKLQMTERAGIEIDYCPTCRGVWLDRGELDKIIERSTQTSAPAMSPEPYRYESEHHDKHHDEHYKHGKLDHHGRRRSWLSDLFD